MLEHVVEVVDANVETRSLIVHHKELLVTEGQTALVSVVSWHLNFGHLMTRLHVKDENTFYNGSGKEIFGVFGDVDGASSGPNVNDARSHALVRIINVHLLIVGASKEEVALKIVEHLSHRTRMSSEKDRLHRRKHS